MAFPSLPLLPILPSQAPPWSFSPQHARSQEAAQNFIKQPVPSQLCSPGASHTWSNSLIAATISSSAAGPGTPAS